MVRNLRKKTGGNGGRRMKQYRKKKIGVATCLLVLITSGLGMSALQNNTIATDIENTDCTERVVVQFIDESCSKEIVVTLTKEKVSALEAEIASVSKDLQTTTSKTAIREILNEALSVFNTFHLFNEVASQEQLARLFDVEQPGYLPNDQTNTGKWIIRWNAWCLIAGDTTNTVFTGIPFTILDRIATWLQNHGYGSRFISLRTILWLLDNFKPFSVFHSIHLGLLHIPGGIRPAEGWIVTCGLTGIRKWTGSITGNIMKNDLCGTTGVLGFTGIKIMHKEVNRHFYLGKALLVSIT